MQIIPYNLLSAIQMVIIIVMVIILVLGCYLFNTF